MQLVALQAEQGRPNLEDEFANVIACDVAQLGAMKLVRQENHERSGSHAEEAGISGTAPMLDVIDCGVIIFGYERSLRYPLYDLAAANAVLQIDGAPVRFPPTIHF